MPLSWEEKKDIRRQLTHNLGRTPTNQEFEAALLPKYFSGGMDITNPQHWSKIYNAVTGAEDDSPGKLASSFVQDERGLTKSQGTLLDESLKKEKDEGQKLVEDNEKLLNLKPFSLERPSGTAEDLIGLAPKPTAEIQTPYDSALQPMSEELEIPKLPTDDEQLRDIYLKQGDFTYPKEKTSTSSGQLKNQKDTSLEDEEFNKASQQADYNRAQARLMSAVGGLSTSIANLGNIGTPIENKFKEGTDDLLKSAGEPLTRLKEKRAMYEELIKNRELAEDRNPQSKKSIAYRELAKGLGMQVSGNETAADLAKLINVATQKYQSDEARASRLEAAKLKKEEKDDAAKNDYLRFATSQSKALVDTYAKIQQSSDAIDGITGKNPAEDVTALYNFISTLDPNSVVREGEIELAKNISALTSKITILKDKAVNGKVIPHETVLNIKREVKRLADVAKKSYDKKMSRFIEGAKNRGISEERFKEFDPFRTTEQKTSQPSQEEINLIKQRYEQQGHKITDAEAVEAIRQMRQGQ